MKKFLLLALLVAVVAGRVSAVEVIIIAGCFLARDISRQKALRVCFRGISHGGIGMIPETGVTAVGKNFFMYIVTVKFQEVQKHLIAVIYTLNSEIFRINLAWFSNFKSQYKNILAAGSQGYAWEQNAFRVNTVDMYSDIIWNADVVIYAV